MDFESADGLKTRNGKAPTGFELCDGEGKWVFAKARILVSGIELQSGEIKKPSSVRYGWVPFPEPRLNLINSNGLPAAPFFRDVQ